MQAIPKLIQNQRDFFNTNQTKDYQFRKTALKNLYHTISKHEDEITKALHTDLNKSTFEAYTTEIGIVLSEIRYTLKYLQKWMKPKKVKTPLTHIGSKSYIYSDPYGVSLIISPWNYPFQLAIAPLIGAIAAGNCAVIKPSELAPHTANIINRIIQENFPDNYVTVVQGDAQASTQLLEEQFDYIFFTGGEAIGKIIMSAAAKHITPITLELGGKSPCIVHKDANIDLAAKRIAWGKFLNAGQTCVAPDYIYVHEQVKDEFLHALQDRIIELYGKSPLSNKQYPKIINKRHFERLINYLADGNVYFGGKYAKEQLMIEPTILTDVSLTSKTMQEELFGPILPILTYKNIDSAITEIKTREKPLTFYTFTENKAIANKLLSELSFGGGCINDVVYHIATPYLPFGGVGTSGKGAYHGYSSFKTFSHEKSILKQTTLFDLPMRYPTMKNGLKWVKRFMK